MGLDEVLKIADIVSLHLPLTEQTRNLIDRRALSLMRPGALLVNAARGGVVNEQDLFEALQSRRLAGAGLDVFAKEPPGDSPLLTLDNVVLTPHTAAFTHEAMNKMNHAIVDQILAWARGEKPTHSVNAQIWPNPH
jgi:phosphoglycerate dehydrogenase-like enzyme